MPRPGSELSIAKATDQSAPIQLATTSTVGSSELIEDVAQVRGRSTVLEQIDAPVVEGIGHAVTRPVDCEHAVGLARAARIGTTSNAPLNPPWTYRSGEPTPSSKTCVSPWDQRIRRTRVSGANRASRRRLRLFEFPIRLCLHK